MRANLPADLWNASVAISISFFRLRSALVPICEYNAPTLNRILAFSRVTERWTDGVPVMQSYLKQ